MRSNLPLMMVCVFFGSLGIAQDKDVNLVDVAKMINALASDNPTPKERRGPDLKYPTGYDRKKQEPVLNALSQLKAMGPAAFKSLYEIQLLVVDWVIDQEKRHPKDFAIKELEAMKKVRAMLLKSKTPNITRQLLHG